MNILGFVKKNKAILLIVFTGLVVFLNTFQNGFVYDDQAFIVDNRSIRDIKNIPGYFVSSQYFSSKGNFRIYRPLVTVTFAIDYLIWKLNPFGYHIWNTVFHILGAIMVFFVFQLLLKQKIPALIGALFFLVHPVQTEAVTWIAGRGNTICLFLCLLSFFHYIKFRDRQGSDTGKHYKLSIIFYIVALFAKEMAICLPLILIAYDFTAHPANWAKIIYRKKGDLSFLKEYVPFFIVSVLYIILRYLAIGEMAQTGYWGGSIFATALTMVKVFVYYVRLIVFPVNLCVDNDIPVSFSILEPFVLFSIAFMAGVFFLAIRLYKHSKLASFGILWFMIALLPVANIIPIQALLAERFLYMPSVGFCLLVAVAVSAIKLKKKNLPYILAFIVIILFSGFTIVRNRDWRSNYTLWSNTLDNMGNSYKALTSLGVHAAEEENYEQALEYYLQALELNPNFGITRNNLGNTLQKMDRYEEAIKEYEYAIRLDENYYEAYANMGNAYKRMKDYASAELNYRKALSIRETYIDARFNLGVTFADTGRQDEAVEMYERVVKDDPEHVEALNNLAVIYRDKGLTEKAIELFREAIRRDPEYSDSRYNLAVTYNVGRVDEMIEQLLAVLENDAEFKEANYNLGVAYENKGMFAEAIEAYKNEIKVNPGYISSYKNVGILYSNAGDTANTLINWKKYVELSPNAPDSGLVRQEIEKMEKGGGR